MKLSEIINEFGLEKLTRDAIDHDIQHGYSCDLLSQVLSSAKSGSIWLTIQSHLNTVGVASMVGITAIIICEGHKVPSEVIEKADEENVALLRSNENAFELSGKLYERGIR